MRALQAAGLGLNNLDCCPKPCPDFQARICCTKCPATCDEAPSKMNAITVTQSQRFCNKSQMAWDPPVSCAPISKTEMQCKGADGNFTNLPVIPGAFAAWTLDVQHFYKSPFNLKAGDALECRIRSFSRIDWSEWSDVNQGYKLPVCDATQNVMSDSNWQDPNCRCKRSCQASGCGGCCNHQVGTFWSKAKNAACCASGQCTEGCQVKSLADAMHRHKYCHVHQEDKNRTRKKTKWEMKVVKRQQQILRPFKTKVMRLKLMPTVKSEQRIKWETKEVRENKTVMRKEKKKQIKIVMEKKTEKQPRMSVVKKTRMVAKTLYRDVKEMKKVIKMVKVKKTIDQVKYVNKEIKRKAIRMVMQKNTIQKEVPKNIPVPLAALSSVQVDNDCGCFRENCDCLGSPGCGCCYPRCGCAPSMLSPTEVELVSRTEDVQVPEEYIETVTIEMPTMVQSEVEVMEPEEATEEVTIQEPYVVNVEEEYEEPTLIFEDVEVEVPVETEEEIEIDVPVTIEVIVERRVPVTTSEPVTIQVPTEVPEEIIEQRATMEDVDIEVPVAVEYEERIAAPPCHWHDIKHSHDIKVGLTHTHHHKD